MALAQLLVHLRALIRHPKIIVVVRLGETKRKIRTLLDQKNYDTSVGPPAKIKRSNHGTTHEVNSKS